MVRFMPRPIFVQLASRSSVGLFSVISLPTLVFDEFRDIGNCLGKPLTPIFSFLNKIYIGISGFEANCPIQHLSIPVSLFFSPLTMISVAYYIVLARNYSYKVLAKPYPTTQKERKAKRKKSKKERKRQKEKNKQKKERKRKERNVAFSFHSSYFSVM